MSLRFPLLLSVLLFCIPALASDPPEEPPKRVVAMRTNANIAIDGIAEAAWDSAPIATDFIQLDPTEGIAPSQHTEVRFLYSSSALYVFANCYDTAPDSILAQLGERDDNLNADKFNIKLDTYNSKIDAFSFGVSASGVQEDYRFSDGTYDAVWSSAVKIHESGWSVELEIPYSAFRFPSAEKQSWGLQITRTIRRHREFVQWSLTPKGEDNFINFWGVLEGLQGIEAPIRLQFTPYLTTIVEAEGSASSTDWSYQLAGGLDLKYGINESFTLDMTLLPDFSQVQSDNQVKNLGAFEIVFQERRPFFQEGTDLFTSGDLFYSRRIGRVPLNHFAVEDELQENERIEENPTTARLLNATKISGRTVGGTGLGVFNAVTGSTFATVKDTITGDSRKVLTDPLTNYNIIVADRNLPHNSRVYLINTNVTRNGSWYDANVSGGGFQLSNKKSSYRLSGDAAYSNKFGVETESGRQNVDGYQYAIGLARITGKWKFNLWNTGVSKDWDPNDLGLNFRTNISNSWINGSYSILNPVWKVNSANFNLGVGSNHNFSTGELMGLTLNPNASATFRNFLSVWAGSEMAITDGIDYWEPRVEGRFWLEPKYTYSWAGFSSDYRKKLALDGSIEYAQSRAYSGLNIYAFWIEPIWRISDKFLIRQRIGHEHKTNDIGFSTLDSLDNPVFGGRRVNTWNNVFQGKYLFRNNLALSLRVRHFWTTGEYLQFYDLQQDGTLVERDWDENQNFNFNAFNVDLVFSWQFGPGSFLRVVYKNAILDDSQTIQYRYFDNLGRTLELDQVNSLSVRVIWFLDYLNFKKKR